MAGAHIQSQFSGEGGELSDGEAEDAESVFSHMDMLSPSHHTDAQTLAMMLKEQLDAINNEIRSVFGCLVMTPPPPNGLLLIIFCL